MHNYRELEIWNEGIELAKIVYQMTLEFPKEEIYGLTSQRFISVEKMAPVLQKLDVLQKKIYRFKQKVNSYK